MHFAQGQSRPCFSLCPSPKRLGVHKRLGGDATKQMIQTNQRHGDCHLMSCSAIQREGRGLRWGLATCCSGTAWASVCLRREASVCLCVPCFAFFLSSSTSPSLIKPFLSQPTSFLVFTLPFLFPCPTWERGSEQALCGASLLTGVNAQQSQARAAPLLATASARAATLFRAH